MKTFSWFPSVTAWLCVRQTTSRGGSQESAVIVLCDNLCCYYVNKTKAHPSHLHTHTLCVSEALCVSSLQIHFVLLESENHQCFHSHGPIISLLILNTVIPGVCVTDAGCSNTHTHRADTLSGQPSHTSR